MLCWVKLLLVRRSLILSLNVNVVRIFILTSLHYVVYNTSVILSTEIFQKNMTAWNPRPKILGQDQKTPCRSKTFSEAPSTHGRRAKLYYTLFLFRVNALIADDPDFFPVSGRRFISAMAAQDLVDTVEGIRRGKVNVVIPGDVGDPSAMGSFHDVATIFF